MKKTILIAALLAGTVVFAQNEDRLEKTTTTRTTTKDHKGTNVDVKQQKDRQAETLRLDQSGNTNQNATREKSFSSTKALSVDGSQYSIHKDDKGYTMMRMENGKQKEYGKIRKIDENNAYFLIIDDKQSIGFFDDSGNFILKTYEPKTDEIVSMKYRIKR